MTDLIVGLVFIILTISTLGFIYGLERLKEQK
jgi:hypothetical protein